MKKFFHRLFGGTAHEAQVYHYSEFRFAQDRMKILRAIKTLQLTTHYDGVIACTGGGEFLGRYLSRQLNVPCTYIEVDQRIKRILPVQTSDPAPHFMDNPRITLGRASMPTGTYLIAAGWLPSAQLITALQRRYTNCSFTFAALLVSELTAQRVRLVYGRKLEDDVEPKMFWDTW